MIEILIGFTQFESKLFTIATFCYRPGMGLPHGAFPFYEKAFIFGQFPQNLALNLWVK